MNIIAVMVIKYILGLYNVRDIVKAAPVHYLFCGLSCFMNAMQYACGCQISLMRYILSPLLIDYKMDNKRSKSSLCPTRLVS